MARHLTKDIIRQLELERQAILEGAFGGLAAMTATKEELIARLELDPPPDDDLRDIHRRAERNRHLLQAALRGMRSVADRMSTLRQVQGTFDSYTQEGARQSHAMTPPAFERKA